MSFRQSSILSAAVLACVLPASAARADDASAEIATLLEEGWRTVPGALAEARRRFDLAQGIDATDARADFALALVLLNRHEYDEARKHFDAAVKMDRANLDAWRGGFWLAMYRDDHRGALVRMKALAGLYPEKPVSGQLERSLCETAGWMGRMIGFLAGPGADAADAELRQSYEEQIAARLAGDRLEAFTRGRQEVLARHEELQETLAQLIAEDAVDAEKSRRVETDFLSDEEKRIAEEKAALADEEAELKVAADKKLAEIDAELEPAMKRYRELAREAGPLKKRLKDFEDYIENAASAARRAKGRARDELLDAVQRARNKMRPIEEQYEPLETEGKEVQEKINRLGTERVQTVQQFQAAMKSIDARERKLRFSEKMLDKTQRSVDRIADAETDRVRALKKRIASIATYQKFPVEAVRDGLLRSLRK